MTNRRQGLSDDDAGIFPEPRVGTNAVKSLGAAGQRNFHGAYVFRRELQIAAIGGKDKA